MIKLKTDGKWLGGFWTVQTLENQYPLTQIVNFSEYIIPDEKGEF